MPSLVDFDLFVLYMVCNFRKVDWKYFEYLFANSILGNELFALSSLTLADNDENSK